jgi:phenylpropionate dioxygenase-like ring-hydroxylating dioxygenase large terminal subunit
MQPIDFGKDQFQTVSQILRADPQQVPSIFLTEPTSVQDTSDIPREIFFSRHHHDIETEKLWQKVWHAACLEEDIPNVGDRLVHDLADLSVIIVRTAPGEIRAFYNSCLHRGTQLQIGQGNGKYFQCPFHGWRWNLDGSLAHIPCRWDFPQVSDEAFHLPELKVSLWQGIVFVNYDQCCESLESYLENIPDQFRYIAYPPKSRFTAVHIVKEMPANWKVTMEAFLESYHFMATHPQVLHFTGIAQCDLYGRHARSILPVGVGSPYFGDQLDEMSIAKRIAIFEGVDPAMVDLPPKLTARAYAAMAARQRLGEDLGVDCSTLLDTEVLDVMSYFIFPNLVLTPSLGFPVLMKFQPNGNDPDSCMMEVRLLLPIPAGQSPPKAKRHLLGREESWKEVPGFARIGAIFDQDTANLLRIQRGLKASGKSGVTFSQDQESILRHFHRVLALQLAQ